MSKSYQFTKLYKVTNIIVPLIIYHVFFHKIHIIVLVNDFTNTTYITSNIVFQIITVMCIVEYTCAFKSVYDIYV